MEQINVIFATKHVGNNLMAINLSVGTSNNLNKNYITPTHNYYVCREFIVY